MIEAIFYIVMDRAFEMVRNQDDWKAPIDAHVDVEDINDGQIIAMAIEFYTATRPIVRMVERDENGFRLSFEAAGYRAGPAA